MFCNLNRPKPHTFDCFNGTVEVNDIMLCLVPIVRPRYSEYVAVLLETTSRLVAFCRLTWWEYIIARCSCFMSQRAVTVILMTYEHPLLICCIPAICRGLLRPLMSCAILNMWRVIRSSFISVHAILWVLIGGPPRNASSRTCLMRQPAVVAEILVYRPHSRCCTMHIDRWVYVCMRDVVLCCIPSTLSPFRCCACITW